MLHIVHAADFHLDSPFERAGCSASTRRREQRELLRRAAGEADDCALFLLAGDLFDGARVYPETLEALSDAFSSCGAHIFIAPGNHDFYGEKSPYRLMQFPENVHLFTSEDITAVTLASHNCVVYGAAFTSSRCSREKLRGFHAPDDGRIHIMLLHGEVLSGDGMSSSHYGPIRTADIEASGLHYLALGHVHRPSGLCRAGKTFYAYPGCPEGRGFDETGETGILKGSVSPDGADLRLVPIAKHRYELVELELNESSDPEQMVLEQLSPDSARDHCRVILTGTAPNGGIDLAQLESRLAPRFFELSILDRTRPPEDIWSRQEEETLTGLFLRELRARYQNAASEEERFQILLALRLGKNALESREEL